MRERSEGGRPSREFRILTYSVQTKHIPNSRADDASDARWAIMVLLLVLLVLMLLLVLLLPSGARSRSLSRWASNGWLSSKECNVLQKKKKGGGRKKRGKKM